MLLCSPDQSLKQLEQMQGDILCCSHWNLVPGSISMTSISTSGSWNTATLPETLSQWKLKVLFPHVRILKEMATIKTSIFVTLANEFHYCLLPVPKQLQLILPQALKTEMKIVIFQEQVWTAEQKVFSCLKIFDHHLKDLLMSAGLVLSILRFRVSFSWTGFQDPLFLKIFLS